MMKCPSCGALNSVKRKTCFQCEAELGAAPPSASGPLRVCKNCVHSTVFPPAGVKIGEFEVWCLRLGKPKDADSAAEACFELSFTWRREESLD